MDPNEKLKLDNQLCFPMYLTAKQIITKYGEFLSPLDLTYTQYLVMMVLWEYGKIDMKALGDKLGLDSSTLTPLLNRLVKKEYLNKLRDENDKRTVNIQLTPKGLAIKEKAVHIPEKIFQLVDLTPEEAQILHSILQKIIHKLSVEN